jgi:hypothetical protein
MTKDLEEAQLAEAVAAIRKSLEGMDRARALYHVVKLLVGDTPEEEIAVCHPDSGKVVAYLVPPGLRHARKAALRREPLPGDSFSQRF